MKVNMNIMKKSMTGAFLALAAVSTGNIEPMAEACTRAVYIGPEQMVITRRKMTGKKTLSNIYVFSSWNETSRIQQGRNRELDL